MYEIRPETIKSFIEDTNIKLPRFQRKQTWDDKKNFQLCISIFKGYPIGVSILNNEVNDGVTTRWLLDGRQRRNALTQFYKDPENLYNWAKKFIGFKANDQLQDLEEKFWDKLNIYLEEDELDDSYQETNSEEIDDQNVEQLEVNEDEPFYDSSKKGIELLLHIIKLVHNKTKKHSGFTRPFDFSKEINNLPYKIIVNGKSKLSSQKLKTFIRTYMNFCTDELIDYKERDSFSNFMKNSYPMDEKTLKKVEIKIEQNWDKIFERIDILEKINNLYMNSKIALIEVKNLKSVDAQKIFNIINSGGTPLSAVEILSAKPSWNIPIKNPSSIQINHVNNLYKRLEIQNNNDIVKWDLPATFISRLDNSDLLFKEFSSSHTDSSKEITLGFKFLSGVFEEGVKKEDIDNLARNKEISWDTDYEEFVNDVNMVSKLIASTEYFKYLKSWKFSIIHNLSDAIALNFLLLMFKDWKRKNKPIGNDTKTKQFQKNAFILIDNLIYEYVTKQWRGSSDSKIAKNISILDSQNDIFTPLDKDKWKELIEEILDEDSIDAVGVTQAIMQPILYHFYALSKIQGPSSNYSIEVDHIIPQAQFKSSSLKNKDVMVHNIFNLALLPKDENVGKSNKLLTEITDSWLIDQIEKYAFISENDFRKYSDLSNLNDLKKNRGKIILKAFDSHRDKILNN